MPSKLPFKEDFPAHFGIVGSLVYAAGAFLPCVAGLGEQAVNSFKLQGFGEIVIALAAGSLAAAILQSHELVLATGVGGVIYVAAKFLNRTWIGDPKIGWAVLFTGGVMIILAGFLGVRSTRRTLRAGP